MSIESNIELYLSNRSVFQRAWKGSSNLDFSLASLLCTVRNISADDIELQKCEKLLKKKLSTFSHFRGFSQSAVISMLVKQDDPEAILDKSIEIYKELSHQFFIDDYLPIGALIIALLNQPERIDQIIRRSSQIFKGLNAKHPLITDSQDSILCILLGCSEFEVDRILEHTEKCMRLLKKGLFNANHYQSLGMILALYPQTPEEKAARVKELLDEFSLQKILWGRSYELALTGSLAMSGYPAEDIVQKVQYADMILSSAAGFQLIDTGSYRTMLAASLVLDDLYKSDQSDVFVLASLSGMLISEYIDIMVTTKIK